MPIDPQNPNINSVGIILSVQKKNETYISAIQVILTTFATFCIMTLNKLNN